MQELEEIIRNNKVAVFSKCSCRTVRKVTDMFKSMKIGYREVQLDKMGEDGDRLHLALYEKTGQKSVPNTFVNGWHVGGLRYMAKCAKDGTLKKMIRGSYEGYHYDLMVIGEGPGANMAALESARLGLKVAFCNYLIPTPENKRSGITRRGMDLGCFPGKQIQKAGIIGTHIADSPYFGWHVNKDMTFVWEKLIANVKRHASDLHSVCAKTSGDLMLKCFNTMPRFHKTNVVKLTDNDGTERVLKIKDFIIVSSPNAEHLCIPGSNYGIYPDDVFCLEHHPGKVLIIGCSEAGLCCAGALTTCSVSVTIVLGTNYMAEYDEQMMDRLIQDLGANIYTGAEVKRIDSLFEGKPGECAVTIAMADGREIKEKFNTIVFAEGSLPNIEEMRLESIGVPLDKDAGRLITDEQGRTAVKNIFALGGISQVRRLSKFVSRRAMLLVHKLYGNASEAVSVGGVPSLVRCSIDYAFLGLSEEEAKLKYGEDNIEVYHSEFKPVEYRFSSRFQKCYVKLLCIKDDSVVGLHLTGPYAGDVVQGFALGMKLGAKRSDFQHVIGIHPTTAEELTGKLIVTKSSGEPVERTEC